MANPSFEQGSRGSDYKVEQDMKAVKYDGRKFIELVSSELIHSKNYKLIKSEMFGKPDASKEKITQDKINEYFEGLGGDEFGQNIFNKGKKSLLADAIEANSNPEAYWQKYAKSVDENTIRISENVSNKQVAYLASKELAKLSEVSFKDAIANDLYPKFGAEEVTLRALQIWETQEKSARLKALKKSAATSGAVRRRVTLQEQVKGYDQTVHKAEYQLGSAEMAAEFAKTAATLDKTLKYRAIGGVSTATWNAEKPRTESEWRTRWQTLAKQFGTLYVSGRLYNEFPTAVAESDKVLGIIDALSRLNAKGGMKDLDATFDANDFKRDLDKRFGKELIYGAHGVFNMLLALERANKEVALHGGGSKVLYNLQVGEGKAPEHRFSRLDVQALQEGQVQDAPKDKKEEAKAEKKEAKKLDAKSRKRFRNLKHEASKLETENAGSLEEIKKLKADLNKLDPKSSKAIEVGKQLAQEEEKHARTAQQIKDLRQKIADFEKEYGIEEDIMDQFSDEIDEVFSDLEKSTGVKMTKKTGKDNFANTKFVDIYVEYKGASKKLLHVVLFNRKITLPSGKGEFLNPREALAATKTVLAKQAESFKKEIDAKETQGAKEREAALQAAKEAAKENWYKDFDAFLDANKNDFIGQRIKVGKEFQSKYTLEAPERITITYDYKVTVEGRDIYLVPVIEEGKVKLWARIVNKAGTTMKDKTIAVDFKNPRKFASDLKAVDKEFKDMEKAEPLDHPLPPVEKGADAPKGGVDTQRQKAPAPTPAPVPAAGLPEPATKVAAPTQAPAKATAKAPETAKSLSDGMSTERPKDIATAARQLKEIYDKLDPKIAWGPVMTGAEPSFMLTINNVIQTITARLDDSITKPGEKEIQFIIHNKKTETFRNNQKELAQYIEGLLVVR